MARRRRSRSSCTSAISNSRRFSPMINSRRAKCFEVVAGCPKLAVLSSMPGSISVAGAPARDEVADERADTQADGDGWVGMIVHRLVGRLGALDRFVARTAIDLFAAFQCGGETFPGLADFFSGDVGGGGD